MSLQNLKKDQLIAAANYYGVDLEDDDTKDVILSKLDEDGVDWSMYKRDFETETESKDEAEASADTPTGPEASVPVGDVLLLKMTRANGTFQVRGVTFTRANPYAIVPVDDAEYILDRYEGFRQATPSEVKEFYG